MRTQGMLPTLHSLQFRVHTRVLITLLVVIMGTVVIWTDLLHGLLPS